MIGTKSMKEFKEESFRIAIIGLGYVGLPLATALSEKFSVVGFDVNDVRVTQLNDNNDITGEVESSILKNLSNLNITNSEKKLQFNNIYIVTVPTPIDNNNEPDLTFLESASELVGRFIEKGDIVVFESTVYPGCTEEFCIPIIEKKSTLKYNIDFFAGYSPERINPGDKVHTIKKIKKVISASNKETLDKLEFIYGSVIEAGIFKASSIKVAEAAKVIENSQRDLNIAFVNELSHIFRKIGIDTHDVLEAAGTKWNFLPFVPGLVGGHCISVDPYYLTYKAEALGYKPEVLLSGRKINDNFPREISTNLIKTLNEMGLDPEEVKIGIFGLTFKENCPDLRNSKVFDFIEEFLDWGSEVLYCDPHLLEDEIPKKFKKRIKKINNTNDIDVICMMVPHKEFLKKSFEEYRLLCEKSERPVFFDLKSAFDRSTLEESGFQVMRI